MKRFIFLTTALLTISTPAFSQQSPDAQRWVQIKEATQLSAASDAAHPISAQYFVPEIYFDPTALNSSRISLSSVYAPQGQADNKDKAFHWTFVSSGLTKTGEGTYEARGEIQSDKGRRNVTVPLRVSLTKDHMLMIDGSVPIKQGEYNFGGLSALYPADISATFHITAKPLFSGDGKFVLE